MSKLKVIVSRAWPEEVQATLREKYDVTLNEKDIAMTKDEMKDALAQSLYVQSLLVTSVLVLITLI